MLMITASIDNGAFNRGDRLRIFLYHEDNSDYQGMPRPHQHIQRSPGQRIYILVYPQLEVRL